MAQINITVTAVVVIIAVYVFRALVRGYGMRSKLHNLPGPPHSMIWGHLQYMGEQVASLPRRIHPHVIPLRLKQKYGLGSFFYLDLWPFANSMVVVMDPAVSQQMSVENNTLKHPQLPEFLLHLAGKDDMVSANGAVWKKWRSIFNPGFASTHLMSLVPGMVDEASTYVEILGEHAASGQPFRLEEATTRLTIDVIGKVVLDIEFNMQRGENECVRALREQIHLLPNESQYSPVKFANPFKAYRRWRNARTMTTYIGKILDERFAARSGKASADKQKNRSRTVMDLALDSYLAGEGQDEKQGAEGATAAPQLDAEFKAGVTTQIRIFLFAGHDTTSSTICYALYLLSKHPECLERIRREHEAVLGPLDASAAAIKADPYLLNKLEYTTAVIKETLRLFPAASAPRLGAPDLFIRDPHTGESYPTNGLMIWLVHYATQRNPDVWGPSANVFDPARFLLPNAAKIPEGAFRAFEAGPRNCIGQNLALLESRIVLALVARRFDVRTAWDALEGVLSRDGSSWAKDPSFRGGIQEHDGEQLYQVLVGAAKPREGMPARVSEANWTAPAA